MQLRRSSRTRRRLCASAASRGSMVVPNRARSRACIEATVRGRYAPRAPPAGCRCVLTGSLGVVFDHVGIAVSDLAASERFYRTVLPVLGIEPSHADAELVEWEDWAIGPTAREHPVTRGLHVGFRAPDRAAVDAFWQAGIDAGYRDDGAPGPRTASGRAPCPTAASTTCGSAWPTSRRPSASTPPSRPTPGSGWGTTSPAAFSSRARTTASR